MSSPRTAAPSAAETASTSEPEGGHVTQFLRRREAENRAAEQAADLKELSTVAHELAGETDLFAARSTLCRAVLSLTGCALVVLLEPPFSSFTRYAS